MIKNALMMKKNSSTKIVNEIKNKLKNKIMNKNIIVDNDDSIQVLSKNTTKQKYSIPDEENQDEVSTGEED
jgi:uncharacterized protein YqeY